MLRRLILRLLNAVLPKPADLMPKGNVNPDSLAYVLYIGIREYNGNFKEEITFRNSWTEHEKAQYWLNLIKAETMIRMKEYGVEPLVEEELKLGE